MIAVNLLGTGHQLDHFKAGPECSEQRDISEVMMGMMYGALQSVGTQTKGQRGLGVSY